MTPRVIESYRKDLKWPAGHGYGRNIGTDERPIWSATRATPLSAEVVHTTSNDEPTSLEHELIYMRDTPIASCNDLIAKNGDVYIILPEAVPAWHAGVAIAAFTNPLSFGTELHVSLGEKPMAAQIASLTWRVQQRRQRYTTTRAHIETHRAVALPKGRKVDPEGWPDQEFYAWRNALFAELDYPALWGSHYPYFAASGIATAWRDSYRTGQGLGAAVSDEFTTSIGVIRAFVRGYIVYTAAGGVKVHLW